MAFEEVPVPVWTLIFGILMAVVIISFLMYIGLRIPGGWVVSMINAIKCFIWPALCV